MRVRLTAISPITHGGFGLGAGNASALRRMALVSVDGMPQVPCISGNSLRGNLRRLVFRELFHRAEVTPELLGRKAWDKLYAALANGGHLTGSEGSAKTEKMRELRSLLPPLSLFGAALYKYMLPGHFSMGIAWPVCRETVEAGLIDRDHPELLCTSEELVEEVGYVRHADREHQDPGETKVTPMPTTLECLSAGTELVAEVSFAAHATDVERAVLAHGLNGLEWVGAKASAGHGRVSVEHDGDAQPYIDWLASTNDLQDRIKQVAEGLK